MISSELTAKIEKNGLAMQKHAKKVLAGLAELKKT